MISLTPYNFQPVFRRLVVLYGYAQAVTDCATFVLSCLCCQCWEPMPLSHSSAGCTFRADIDPPLNEKVEIGRGDGEPVKPQHLVIDFTPGRDDTPELQQKVCKFWNFVDRSPELDEFLEQPFRTNDSNTRSGVTSKDSQSGRIATIYPSNDFPAIHSLKTLNKNGINLNIAYLYISKILPKIMSTTVFEILNLHEL
ncbi:unnamed protein product [Leptosia nina]|uniref:Uncharacterized protein n=1 Tax=Leptosia nina TaxID=320188 RepID=A0AAV1JFA8_9NEOP